MIELKNLASKYFRSDESFKFDEDVYIRKRPRLIEKCGELNIRLGHVKKRRRRLLKDLFTTALDIGWFWHVLIYLLLFFFSWVAFGFLWYALAFYRGDMLLIDSPTNATLVTNLKRPCVVGMSDFTSALLFSIETQNTIGYGSRHITEECHAGIIILMFQSYFGILLQGLVTGVVFAKISIPNKRKKTIVFSRNAVISHRDGKLCFMFKIGNIRESQLSDTRVRILMIKSRNTLEGEWIPFEKYEMKVGPKGDDFVFFPWPKVVEHIIDEESPFYEICKEHIDSKSNSSCESFSNNSDNSENKKKHKDHNYEIVVILEGKIETTGASCHIRTSYLPQEIYFGFRFTPVFQEFSNCEYIFDYSKFDQIEAVDKDLFYLNEKDLNCYQNRVSVKRVWMTDLDFNLENMFDTFLIGY